MPSPADRMLAAGGVALDDAADAARCYPDLWPSAEASRKAFQRARREDVPNLGCPAPLRRAAYRRTGAGTRATILTFDPAVVPPDELRDWLEERVGPLARFDLADQPTPDPSLPVEAARTPPEPVSELGSYRPTSKAAEAPPGPPEPVPGPPAPSPAAHEALAARMRQQRLQLAALAERLEAARPRQAWGVRKIDWQAWEASAQAAANLPNTAWAAWRDTAGAAW